MSLKSLFIPNTENKEHAPTGVVCSSCCKGFGEFREKHLQWSPSFSKVAGA